MDQFSARLSELKSTALGVSPPGPAFAGGFRPMRLLEIIPRLYYTLLMIEKATRYFNTSGPNIIAKHYTLQREHLINRGVKLVKDERYFTIWAPRQTGKSTYFRMMAQQLEEQEYQVAHVNVENYQDSPPSALFNYLFREIKENWGITLKSTNFGDLQNDIAVIKDKKLVLIIDEIEGRF